MTDVDEEFAAVLLMLAEGFPSVKLRPGTFQAYALALSDLSLAQVREAARRAMRECKYFPTAAELRAFVEPSVDDQALLAWAGLQQAAREVGAWRALQLEDKAAAVALSTVFGSWPAYCALEGPAVAARKAEFVAAFRQARRYGWGAPTTMPGLAERGAIGLLTAGGEVRELSVPVANRLIGDGA